jgi:hypothetical protein
MKIKIKVTWALIFQLIILSVVAFLAVLIWAGAVNPMDSYAAGRNDKWTFEASLNGIVVDTCKVEYPCGINPQVFNACEGWEQYQNNPEVVIVPSCQLAEDISINEDPIPSMVQTQQATQTVIATPIPNDPSQNPTTNVIPESNLSYSLSGYLTEMTDSYIMIGDQKILLSDTSLVLGVVEESDPVTATVVYDNNAFYLLSVEFFGSFFEGYIQSVSLKDAQGVQYIVVNNERYEINNSTFFYQDREILQQGQKVYGQKNVNGDVVEINGVNTFPFDLFKSYRSQPLFSYIIVIISLVAFIWGVVLSIIYSISLNTNEILKARLDEVTKKYNQLRMKE